MLKKIAKILYNLIPFKKHLFLMVKFIYQPSQNIFQHLVFKGPFKVLSGTSSFKIYNTATIIENHLFWKGMEGFEPQSLKLWARISKDADTIFDLGANSGIYSLIAKSENPNSKVYAFECVDRVFNVLKNNIALNKYDVACFKQAVSNKDGIGSFIDDDEPFTQSVIVNMGLEEVADGRGVAKTELHEVKTELITLDTFIEQNNIKSIDLMKIDVETHEPEVIEGFQKHIQAFQPTILIEIIRDAVASSLEEQFSELDYIFFFINETFGGLDYKVEGEPYQKVDSLIDSVSSGAFGNYLICSPAKARELNLI
jgi:FkbM family methyltransferase